MKSIIFFPFTRMRADQVRAMGLFFSGVKVLNVNPETLQDPVISVAVESGRVRPVSVGADQISMIEAQVRSFRDWAAIHKGNEKNLKALIRGDTYFRDETDVTAIQSGIRQGIFPAPASGEDSKEVTDPLLVLRFAELLDLENEAIQSEQDALEQSNSALFAELKGEIDPSDSIPEPGLRPDPGADRTGERIKAWCAAAGKAGLFEEDHGSADYPILVTTSPAVLDYLMTNSDQVINELDIDSIKVHEHDCDRREIRQMEFFHALDEFISGKNPSWPTDRGEDDCSCPAGGLRLIRFSGGALNEQLTIPGTQVVVCLVKLNS